MGREGEGCGSPISLWGMSGLLTGGGVICRYYSPYPDPYAAESKLLICEFCLKYMRKKKAMERHKVGREGGEGKEKYCIPPPIRSLNSNIHMPQQTVLLCVWDYSF